MQRGGFLRLWHCIDGRLSIGKRLKGTHSMCQGDVGDGSSVPGGRMGARAVRYRRARVLGEVELAPRALAQDDRPCSRPSESVGLRVRSTRGASFRVPVLPFPLPGKGETGRVVPLARRRPVALLVSRKNLKEVRRWALLPAAVARDAGGTDAVEEDVHLREAVVSQGSLPSGVCRVPEPSA